MDPSEIEQENPGGNGEAGPRPAGNEGSWHPLQKLLFRFTSIYFVWYALPNLYTPGDPRDNPIAGMMDGLSAWLGDNVLGLGPELTVGATTSSDMTSSYIQLAVMAIGSFAGCLVWTVLDRRRSHYRRLGRWLVVICRYYRLSVMLSYGFAKVFPSQFPFPGLARMLQTYGDSSPMGLLVTFLGYSKAYNVFAGLLEVIGGLLMVTRRTTTLGAMLIAGVMSNVVMMCFCYDLPAKLFSAHVWLMALGLVGLEWRRILDFLVLNRPTPAVVYPPHFLGPKARTAARVVKTLVIATFLFQSLSAALDHARVYSTQAQKPALWGIYDVESFVLDGETLPPLITDARRWQNVIFDTRWRLAVRRMDGKLEHYEFNIEGGNRFTLTHGSERYPWTFQKAPGGTVRFQGALGDSNIALVVKARDPDDFLLLSRGFHWINEGRFDF